MKKLALRFFLMGFTILGFLGMAVTAVATDFKITQLTNNSTHDLGPSVYDGTIAWFRDVSPGPQIYYWNGSTITKITSDNNENWDPSLYDGTIAWQAKGMYWTDSEIYYWDGSTVTQVTNDNKYDRNPSLFNVSIAWVGSDGHDYEIYYWDGSAITNVSDNSTHDFQPSLYDGTIAWTAGLGSYSQTSEIYYWDGSTFTGLTEDDIRDDNPSLYDGTIAWERLNQIYYWDGTDIRNVSNNSTTNDGPSLYDGTIAWRAFDGHDWEIYYWDGSEATQVTDNDINDAAPTLHKGMIAWSAFDGHDWEIYYAELVTQSPPVADAGDNIVLISESQSSTALYGTAADPEDDPLIYRWLEGEIELFPWQDVGENGEATLDLESVPFFSIGEHLLILEVSDGQLTSSDEMTLTIDNSAPQAVPTGAGTYQIGDPVILGGHVSDFDGDWLSYEWLMGDEILFDGQVETLEGGVPVELPEMELWHIDIGTHTLTLRVADEYNAPVLADISVEIVDTEAPTLAPKADRNILWPPNHKMIDVSIEANANDNSGRPVALSVLVASNEPWDGLGDGNTTSDWTEADIDQDNGVVTLQLRAESSGSGNGRIYTITLTATDVAGNSSTADIEIIVPHDKRRTK